MKICQLIGELKSYDTTNVDVNHTCDIIKIGDQEKEISKVAIAMIATPEVIRNAAAWGANFLIVHEPAFYNHFDTEMICPIGEEKKKLLRELGITLFRFHDYAHGMAPDLIYLGQIEHLGLEGERVKGKYWAVNRFILKEPITAAELAKHIENKYNIRHVRIAGCMDKKARDISCCFGTPGHVIDELQECSFVLTGEICEWSVGEIARDYTQFGYNKAVLVLGHIGSEREGMIYLKDILKEKHPEFETEYFECGEVYQYTQN